MTQGLRSACFSTLFFQGVKDSCILSGSQEPVGRSSRWYSVASQCSTSPFPGPLPLLPLLPLLLLRCRLRIVATSRSHLVSS